MHRHKYFSDRREKFCGPVPIGSNIFHTVLAANASELSRKKVLLPVSSRRAYNTKLIACDIRFTIRFTETATPF